MNISWKNCFRVGVSALLLFLCAKYSDSFFGFIRIIIGAASPVIIGLALAYILNIPMSFYERLYFRKRSHKAWVRRSRKPVCMICSLLTLAAIIAIVVVLVLPELLHCVSFIISEIPPLIESLLAHDIIKTIMPDGVLAELETVDWQSLIDIAVNVLKTGISSAFTTTVDVVTSVFSAIVTAFISIIFAVYMLMGKQTLLAQLRRVLKTYLKPKWVEKIYHVFSILNECFHKYIVGQCTEAVILGVLCMIGMLIFRFPYAAMIGALVAFMALIPVVGAFIAAIVGALMILTQSPIKALLFLVFIVILQQLEGNLIYPRVVGKSVGLPSMWVLAAVTIGGSIMGVLGMLVAVPLAAAAYRLIGDDISRRERLKKKQKQKS